MESGFHAHYSNASDTALPTQVTAGYPAPQSRCTQREVEALQMLYPRTIDVIQKQSDVNYPWHAAEEASALGGVQKCASCQRASLLCTPDMYRMTEAQFVDAPRQALPANTAAYTTGEPGKAMMAQTLTTQEERARLRGPLGEAMVPSAELMNTQLPCHLNSPYHHNVVNTNTNTATAAAAGGATGSSTGMEGLYSSYAQPEEEVYGISPPQPLSPSPVAGYGNTNGLPQMGGSRQGGGVPNRNGPPSALPSSTLAHHRHPTGNAAAGARRPGSSNSSSHRESPCAVPVTVGRGGVPVQPLNYYSPTRHEGASYQVAGLGGNQPQYYSGGGGGGGITGNPNSKLHRGGAGPHVAPSATYM